MTLLIRDSEYTSYFFKKKRKEKKERAKKVLRSELMVEKTAVSQPAVFSQLDYIQ